MAQCKFCGLEEIFTAHGHCQDRFILSGPNGETNPYYVPSGFGIGGGDDLSIIFCGNCGQIQGNFPIDKKLRDFIKTNKHRKE